MNASPPGSSRGVVAGARLSWRLHRLAAEGEICVCELEPLLGLAQPTVSHHLRVLGEAGLVEARREGTWAYYRLVPEAVAALASALGGRAEAAASS